MTTITLKDGWYYDQNNNRWRADYETEESAIKKSKSLTNCFDCSDCSCCIYCSGCSFCSRCSYCSYCSRCIYCSDCYDCSDCSYCSYCYGIIDFGENPQRYTTPRIGSRNAQTTLYWTKEKHQVYVCSTNIDTIETFEARVRKVHASNEKHLADYLKQIEIMKYLLSQ